MANSVVILITIYSNKDTQDTLGSIRLFQIFRLFVSQLEVDIIASIASAISS